MFLFYFRIDLSARFVSYAAGAVQKVFGVFWVHCAHVFMAFMYMKLEVDRIMYL